MSMDVREGRESRYRPLRESQVVSRGRTRSGQGDAGRQVLVGRNNTRRAYNNAGAAERTIEDPLPVAGDKLFAAP